MSYKPTKEELIDYLYGELEEGAKVKIEQYLKVNPNTRQELETLTGTQAILSQWEDEEAPAPFHLFSYPKPSEWHYWRKFVAIAATILILLTFGWATDFHINYDDTGFKAGFGTPQENLTEEQVQSLLAANQKEVLQYLDTNMGLLKKDMDNKVLTVQTNLANTVNQLEKTDPSEETIYLAIDHKKQELVDHMVRLNEKLVADYREIFNQLIANFSDNWENQRIEDLREIQAAIVNLEDATANRQGEVEEALFNLSQEINILSQAGN